MYDKIFAASIYKNKLFQFNDTYLEAFVYLYPFLITIMKLDYQVACSFLVESLPINRSTRF